MKLLTKEQWYQNSKICFICNEKFKNKYLKDKKYHKGRDHCHYTGEDRSGGHGICNMLNIVHLKKVLTFFIMDLIMIIIYHKRARRIIQKRIYSFRRKHWKIYNLYSSNRRRHYKN